MHLRYATPEDASTLLRFIVELAEYEREPDIVRVTEAELRAQLGEADPPFECLLAEDDGQALGFALFFTTYSTWRGRIGLYLEDLYVTERARGRGIGKALLAALSAEVVRRGGARLEWSVLDWNESAAGFYRGLGAVVKEGWKIYRLCDEPLTALADTAPIVARR